MAEQNSFVADTISFTPSKPSLVLMSRDGIVLFTIKFDGTIERGPGFTTLDEMSLEFWRIVDQIRPKSTA
jgi:hypothetical protein